MNEILEITDKSELEKPLNSKKAVVMLFRSNYGLPCKLQSKLLCEMQSETSGKFKIVKIDVDENSKLAEGYDITVVPTVVVVKDKKTVARIEGLTSKGAIAEILIKYL